MQIARSGRHAFAPEAQSPPSAYLVVQATAAELPARLAELAAQRGPYGLPLARGSLAIVLASEDPHAPWRYGRALPFPLRIMGPRGGSPRAAALTWAEGEGDPDALLIRPAPGAPMPEDLVYSLHAGLAPEEVACVREEAGALHVAIRLAAAALLPDGGELAALRRSGAPIGQAVPAPETPPLPKRPGLIERWLMRRLELA